MSEQVHEVKATLKSLDLSKAGSGIDLEIHWDDGSDREKVGVLKIGYGGLHWKGGNRKKKIHLSWAKLDRLAYGGD